MTPAAALLDRASAFDFEGPDEFSPIRVELRRGPFSPPGREWAVTCRCWCWNGQEWEWEPQPSSRDDAFLDRCRFDRQTALDAAKAIAERELWP